MNYILTYLLTLLFSLSGPAMEANGDFGYFTLSAENVFPKNPKSLLPELPSNPKGYIEPNSFTRIRPEQHVLKPGEPFAHRYHEQHYHVEIRLDPAKSWNNPNNVIKVKPPSYVPGEGTGFLPGEQFHGL